MAWIEYHEALRDHWKIHRLATYLKVRYPEALGSLSVLWLWSVSNSRKGDLKSFTVDEISRAMMLKMVRNDIKKVLQECRLMDENEVLHDWRKHGVSLLDSNRKRQKKFREKQRYSNVTETLASRPTNQPNLTNHTKPTIEDIRALFLEKKSTYIEADKFFNYYESNGWKVGKNPMKNWKAAAAGWITRNSSFKQIAKPEPKITTKKCIFCPKHFTEFQEREYAEHVRSHKVEVFQGSAAN